MVKLKDFDRVALKGSIWAILREHFPSDKEFMKVLRELMEHMKYREIGELREKLNCTKTAYKHPVKHNKLEEFQAKGEGWEKSLPKGYEYYKIDSKDYVYYTNTTRLHKNKREYLLWARLLHRRYQIPLNRFTLTDGEMDSIANKTEYIFDLKFNPKNAESGEKMVKEYLRAYEKKVDKIQEKLFVYDYLETYDEKFDILTPYYKAHTTLYKKIEDLLKTSKKILYTRVFALPLRQHISEEGGSRDDVIARFLTACSENVLHHICTCIRDNIMPEIDETNLIKNGFYLINRCTRTYQYAILDQGLSTEYYRYNLSGYVEPDLLFVESSQTNSLHYNINCRAFESLFKPMPKKQRFVQGNQNPLDIPGVDGLIPLNDLSELLRVALGIEQPDERMERKIKLLASG